MRLDMRAQFNPHRIRMGLCLSDIRLHAINIDEDRRCIHLVNGFRSGHGSVSQRQARIVYGERIEAMLDAAQAFQHLRATRFCCRRGDHVENGQQREA